MFVIVYVVVVSYFLLAAISPMVTTVPDALVEWERIGVLFGLAMFCFWWGGVVTYSDIRDRVRELRALLPEDRDTLS